MSCLTPLQLVRVVLEAPCHPTANFFREVEGTSILRTSWVRCVRVNTRRERERERVREKERERERERERNARTYMERDALLALT